SVPIAIHASIEFGSIAAGPIGKSPFTAANADFGLRSLGAPIATTSAPVPLTKVRRLNVRSEAVIVISSSSSGRRRLRGCFLDRREDAVVGSAAAEILLHQRADLELARAGLDRAELHQRRRTHDHRVRAVTALRRLVV